MTPSQDSKTIESICEVLIENGIPGMREALEKMLNLTMQLERELQTRMGPLELRIPQVRGLSFYPRSLEKGIRSECALKVAIAEMYLQGVSTRKVKAITEELCGYSISSTEVSRIAKVLDEEIVKWRKRSLGIFLCLFGCPLREGSP